MALLDVLSARTSRRSSTAQVACGELGLLTVEALSPAELGALSGDRAVLYAACRELQSAGEELRKAGKVFRPDEVMQFVSDAEARAGAGAVRELSENSGSGGTVGEKADTEIRLGAVQAVSDRIVWDGQKQGRSSSSAGTESAEANREIRRETVQMETDNSGMADAEFRPGTVQKKTAAVSDVLPAQSGVRKTAPASGAADGQVSREFFDDAVKWGKTDKKSKSVVVLPEKAPINLDKEVSMPTKSRQAGDGAYPLGDVSNRDEKPGEAGAKADAGMHEITSETRKQMHETVSELPGGLHEITSEFDGDSAGIPHESTSDFRDGLHEMKSETWESRRNLPHEIKSELRKELHETTSEQWAGGAAAAHEIKSEFSGTVHEMESELRRGEAAKLHETGSEVWENVYETESETAGRMARLLLEGLRRAMQVR